MDEQRGDQPDGDRDHWCRATRQQAQTAFYREQSASLRNVVNAAGLPPEQEEDMVQQVWLAILEHLPAFEGSDAAEQRRCWITAVARNQLADLFRQRSRHPTRTLEELPAEPMVLDEDSPEDRAEQEHQRALLHGWLEELSVRDPVNARLLRGRHIEGRSVAELAAEEGLTPHAVSCRLNQVLAEWRARAARERDSGTASS